MHRVEEVIRRSRFITTVARAPSAEAAQAFVASVRDEFADATHNCWAFVAGPPGSTTHIGMSDDGEPHGTAGRPMLTALLHSGVGEIVAVCTRYYGGVKLGTGGLSRAYSGGVRHALEGLGRERRVERVEVAVTVGYRFVDPVRRIVEEADALVNDEAYGATVRIALAVAVDAVEELMRSIRDATAGEATIEIVESSGDEAAPHDDEAAPLDPGRG